jgi:8-oxo-dGTP diphosphatase
MAARSPQVAVDVVIFSLTGGQRPQTNGAGLGGELVTLLVQVKTGPCAGRWAFPGGLVPLGESLDAAATRELYEKTGIRDLYLEQLYTFGDPRRDPHTHVVSVAYFALVSHPVGPPRDDPKYARVEWRPVRRLPRLAYGHNAVAEYALARLQAKLGYTNIAFGLLPPEFSLGELQRVYEIILGRRLDRRNFHRKITGLGLLRRLGKVRRGAHRPAALYAFAKREPVFVEVL